MKQIYISVINDLVTDQRVHKVALSLLRSGAEITLIGRKLKNSLLITNRPYNTIRFKLLFTKKALFYAEYNLRLFFYLLFKKIDILVANDLDTLLANYCVSKIRGIQLVYDSHEYFAGLPELIDRHFIRKIWLKIEEFILPQIRYSYTVCEPIADKYNEKYGIDMKVIRNFPVCNTKIIPPCIKLPVNNKKIILYQGALNIGRGIELVIRAMQYIEDTIFVIIGDGDISDHLKDLARQHKLETKVHFTGRIPLNELYSYTKQADIGISLEENLGFNYYHALPNKLFDYIQANIPVLASSFPEIEKIVKHYNIGITTESKDPAFIAEQINEMLNNQDKRKEWEKNLKIAAKELCWEKEEKRLLQIFKQAGI